MSFLVRLPLKLYRSDAFSDFDASGFHIGTARACAWLSQLAYEDELAKIDGILKRWKLTRVHSFERPLVSVLPMASTGGFIARGHDCLFISFQGTDPLLIANWVTNFQFAPDKDGVHQGFAVALDSVWPKIAQRMAALKPVKNLVITGHSLGGALAALCAMRCATELDSVANAVYTFGMPRVGTRKFATRYNKRFGEVTYRFVHGHDIVPTVPPPSFQFSHVGRYIRCTANARFKESSLTADESDLPVFVESWLGGLLTGLRKIVAPPASARRGLPTNPTAQLPTGIADHLPDRYWQALAPQDPARQIVRLKSTTARPANRPA